MILDLENERTWPNELITILKTRAITLKIERDAELQAADDGSRWFNPPKTPVTNQTIEEISRLIKSLKIRAYHCTRMLEPEKVFTTGLRILTPIMHKEILLQAMKVAKCTKEEIKLTLSLLERFQEKNHYENREGMIWFILSKKMAQYRDCEVFFRQVGGEVTERALSEAGNTILSKLSSVGMPVLIECSLAVRNAAHFQIDNLTKEFIRYGIKKYTENSEFYFYCEMYVKHEIPKESIQRIWKMKGINLGANPEPFLPSQAAGY